MVETLVKYAVGFVSMADRETSLKQFEFGSQGTAILFFWAASFATFQKHAVT